MDVDKYQAQTRTTAVYPASSALVYLTMGLAGEAGEVANKVKKVIRDYREHPTDLETDAIIDELGDVCWYVAQLSGFLGVHFSSVMRLNQNKLKARKSLGLLKTRKTNDIWGD